MSRSTPDASVTAIKSRAKAKWDKLTDEDLDSVKEGVSGLATRIYERYGISFEDARRQADEFMSAASEMASTAYDHTAEGAAAASRRIDAVVRENPWPALVAAALAGAIIGYAIAAESPRRHWW